MRIAELTGGGRRIIPESVSGRWKRSEAGPRPLGNSGETEGFDFLISRQCFCVEEETAGPSLLEGKMQRCWVH